jgi:hypothetical protein
MTARAAGKSAEIASAQHGVPASSLLLVAILTLVWEIGRASCRDRV